MKHLSERDVNAISDIALMMKRDEQLTYNKACDELKFKLSVADKSRLESLKLAFASENVEVAALKRYEVNRLKKEQKKIDALRDEHSDVFQEFKEEVEE